MNKCCLRIAAGSFGDAAAVTAYKMQVVGKIVSLSCPYKKRTSYGADQNSEAERLVLNRMVLGASTWLL